MIALVVTYATLLATPVAALEQDYCRVPDTVLARASDPLEIPKIEREGYIVFKHKDGNVVMSDEIFHLADIRDRAVLMKLLATLANGEATTISVDKLGKSSGDSVMRVINRLQKDMGAPAFPPGYRAIITATPVLMVRATVSPWNFPSNIRPMPEVPDTFYAPEATAKPKVAQPIPSGYEFGFRGMDGLRIQKRLRVEAEALNAVATEIENATHEFLEEEKRTVALFEKPGDLPAEGAPLSALGETTLKDVRLDLASQGKSPGEIDQLMKDAKIQKRQIHMQLQFGSVVDGRRRRTCPVITGRTLGF